MLKVYFAGPVIANLWRNKIFGFNPLVLEDSPPILNYFKYAGPFVRNDNDDESPSTEFERSLQNIDDCHIVLAYIDPVQYTSALAEIMYAYAKNKYIVAVVNDRIENFGIWFPLQAVDDIWKFSEYSDDLNEVWNSFLNIHPFQDYYKVSNLQEYIIKEYYEGSNFTVLPELINKYDAMELIASIENEKYDIGDIQNKLIKEGALVLKDKLDVEKETIEPL